MLRDSPQYYQIWKHKEVTGLSLPFMFTDMMGGVFNDLSLVFKEKFDVLASVSYSIIVVCQPILLELSLFNDETR